MTAVDESTDSTVGVAFARALARRDAVTLKGLMCPEVEFRALTPGRFWEADTAQEVVDDILLGTWFTSTDEITGVSDIETAVVGGRQRVGYRLSVTRGGDRHLVEQQAYLVPDGDRIAWLRIMCAGYQPAP